MAVIEEIVTALADMAKGIRTLMETQGAGIPDEVIADMTSIADQLDAEATTLEGVASQYPPPPPPQTA